MLNLGYTLEDFENVHGITCVENQFLAILKHINEPYALLFMNSYIAISEIFDEFILNNAKYAYFSKLDRVQKTAKDIGLAKLSLVELKYDEMITSLYASIEGGVPLLIQVDPLKLPQLEGVLPWREDHYISLFGIEEDKVSVLDDIPRRIFSISKEDLKNVYQGYVLEFSKLSSFDQDKAIAMTFEQLKSIAENVSEDKLYNTNAYNIQSLEDILKFRDALGILRISRRRLSTVLKWQNDNCCNRDFKMTLIELEAMISNLDHLYTTVELFRLRKRINTVKLNDMISIINESEKRWNVLLMQEINN